MISGSGADKSCRPRSRLPCPSSYDACQEPSLPSDRVPLAPEAIPRGEVEELEGQVDELDRTYNAEFPLQGLPGQSTSAQDWEATRNADPPRPRNQEQTVGWDGIVQVRQTRLHVIRLLVDRIVYRVETDRHLLVFDDQGTEKPITRVGALYRCSSDVSSRAIASSIASCRIAWWAAPMSRSSSSLAFSMLSTALLAPGSAFKISSSFRCVAA